ncbi:MAG TPA: hypothetical protein VM285_15200 [Polyangia bacterium]|nr:hypothetical protein [Polyangia bacterium]
MLSDFIPEPDRPRVRELVHAPPSWALALQPTWEDFDHKSGLHGLWHTNRVMLHVLVLGRAGGLDERVILQAFCAATIHDQARTHDGGCPHHGKRAVRTKLAAWLGRFAGAGLPLGDLPAVTDAVEHHCRAELPREHRSYPALALLKDADALDRFRLGEPDLDVRMLRHDFTLRFVSFARELVRCFPSPETLEEILRDLRDEMP